MVEGEGVSFGERDPCRESRVIVTDRRPRATSYEEGDRGRRFSRVAVRAGIDPHDPQRTPDEARLLSQFADESLLHGFAQFDEPTGQRPEALEGRVPPTDEQHPSGPYPDRVDREGRILVPLTHGKSEVP
jgi:hypothetical protein